MSAATVGLGLAVADSDGRPLLRTVLFHGWTCHGSPPNRSNRRRCGITIIYCLGDVAGGMAAEGVLVSGDGVGAIPKAIPPPFPTETAPDSSSGAAARL